MAVGWLSSFRFGDIGDFEHSISGIHFYYFYLLSAAWMKGVFIPSLRSRFVLGMVASCCFSFAS